MTRDLSIFVDESGGLGGKARYYLLTLVFRDQTDDILSEVHSYEKRLAENGLSDIAFRSALSKGVLERRKTSMTDYRLEQAANYLCTIELAAVKYAAREDGGPTTSSSAKSAPLRKMGSNRRSARRLSERPPQAAHWRDSSPDPLSSCHPRLSSPDIAKGDASAALPDPSTWT